jgi:hypothetical protein
MEMVPVHFPYYEVLTQPLWAVFFSGMAFGGTAVFLIGLYMGLKGRRERRERRLRLLVLEEEILALRNLPLKETVERLEGPDAGAVNRARKARKTGDSNKKEGRG